MKRSFAVLASAASLALTLGLVNVRGADEITVTGEAKCAKCALHEAKKCETVIQAEKDGKTVTYYLTPNDTATAFHKNICTTPEQVTATGTVSKKDGKKMLTVSKIEPVKS